jgi:hypothetical protein
VQRRRGGGRIELSVSVYGVSRVQDLHLDATTLEFLERAGIRPHSSVGTRTNHENRWRIVDDLHQVLDDKPVPVLAPPVGDDPVRKKNDVAGMLLTVDDDAAEFVVVYYGHSLTLLRARLVRSVREPLRGGPCWVFGRARKGAAI